MKNDEKSRREWQKRKADLAAGAELLDSPVADLETFVLSAMILESNDNWGDDARRVMFADIDKILKPEYFGDPVNRLLFETICRVRNGVGEGNASLLLLINELRQKNQLQDVGVKRVMNLGDIAHSSAYVADYARIIRDYAIHQQTAVRLDALKEDTLLSATERAAKIAEIAADITREVGDDTRLTAATDFFKNQYRLQVERVRQLSSRKTGFKDLDEHLIFAPGLYVCGGSPGVGKTSWCVQLLDQLAAQGEHCVYCTFEQSELEIFSKLLARRNFEENPATTLTAADFRCGGFNHTSEKLIKSFIDSPIDLRVVELSTENIDALLARLKGICARLNSPPIFVVDYLQICPHNRDNAKAGVDEIVVKMKNFLRDSGATMILVSSLNRASYADAISYESFKESGSIEYSADCILALQFHNITGGDKAGLKKARAEIPRRVKLSCLKNRHGGLFETGFLYYPQHDYFKNCAIDELDSFEETTESADIVPL